MIPEPATLTPTRDAINRILHARSIAIVGATERPGYCARLFNNLISTGYAGQIYPINPNRDKVFDLPCYPTPLDLPEAPDLVILVVAGDRVLESLEPCAERGIRSGIVLSAGFAELPGDDGPRRQAELGAFAARTGLRLVGPNCLGAANLADNVWATASSVRAPTAESGAVGAALISQSGASAFGPLLALAHDRGLHYRYVITCGNEADLKATDFIDYFLEQPDVRVISVLAESIRDWTALREQAARAHRAGKVLVVLKVGRSEAGQRGASSHTAALTGNDAVQDVLFRQHGIARARDYDELIEQTLMFIKAPWPSGPRIGVISHSGGIGSHVSDLLGVEGLEVPPIAPETRAVLAGVLGQRGSAANPADLTTFMGLPSFTPILEAMLADPGLDALVVATQGVEERVGRIVEGTANATKPVIHIWTGQPGAQAGLPFLRASHLPVFMLPQGGARGMAALNRVARARPMLADEFALPPIPTAFSNAGPGPLSEHRSRQALAEVGLVSPSETLVQTSDEAVSAAEQLGYPVVLKACSPELLHKARLGLVRLDLRNEQELRLAFEQVAAAAREAAPNSLEGFLVQPFLRGGIETIVGLSRDPQLGTLLLLGLGGAQVEAFELGTWRSCPIDQVEAETMIDDLPALGRLLAGRHGAPPADRPALVQALVQLSALGTALGERLESLEVNPLVVRAAGEGALALDALAILA